jgi:uncharacterized protein (DUF736 family)
MGAHLGRSSAFEIGRGQIVEYHVELKRQKVAQSHKQRVLDLRLARASNWSGVRYHCCNCRAATRILRCAPARRAGASSIASGLQIAIEAAVVAGSKPARRSNMANIGTFKKSGQELQGEIVTLSVQAKGVRIVPETNRTNDNAPSHRVYVGRAEIGAAWSKRSNEGRDYLSVKLDDPSFTAPIYANLFDDEGGETFTLIWSRGRKQNGE